MVSGDPEAQYRGELDRLEKAVESGDVAQSDAEAIRDF
jgi:hypothetical protein